MIKFISNDIYYTSHLILSINICYYIKIYLKVYIIVINNQNEIVGHTTNSLESNMSLDWMLISEHLCDMDSRLASALLNLVRIPPISWGDEMLELWYSMLSL